MIRKAVDIYARRLNALKTGQTGDNGESLLMFIEMGLNSMDSDIRRVAQHGGLGVEVRADNVVTRFG